MFYFVTLTDVQLKTWKRTFRPSEKKCTHAQLINSSVLNMSNVSERNSSSRFCTGYPTAVSVRSVVHACAVSAARAHHFSQHQHMSPFSELFELLE